MGTREFSGPLVDLLDRNIQTLLDLRKKSLQKRSRHQRVVDSVVAGLSRPFFLYLHLILLIVWILGNHGVIGIGDRTWWSFSHLSELASLEAIFLTSLVLINQRGMNKLAEHREDLDLQISLITEHEITKILNVVDAIAKNMKLPTDQVVPHLEDAKKDLNPDMVLKRIESLKDQDQNTNGKD